ncbi:DUF4350 domain-containing protein [Paenibacillus eucommiae]|uniref:DUF4350 domain-containing protein n=1 Tax=Paenibacillus eucommiae TaxID=1355755 RepID=A0ABS4ITJ3_9BACL|nr:DUF4350 domain-containing protein [Paenibacillus eucommiae]MBP1990892.1 hypothetical protein [Paenibacillus eucommiae]
MKRFLLLYMSGRHNCWRRERMIRMRKLNKLHIGLAVSIVLFLCLGYLIVKPERENNPPYLSFSPDADGVKAWRELLESKPGKVREWRLGWGELPPGGGQLLVAVQPGEIAQEQLAEITEWVRQGNDLMVWDQQPYEWAERFPIAIPQNENESGNKNQNEINNETHNQEQAETGLAAGQVRVITQEGITNGQEALKGVVQTSFRLQPADTLPTEQLQQSQQSQQTQFPQQILLSDEQGVLASRVEVGSGSITMVLTPEWLMNGTILSDSHFELVWTLFMDSWDTVWIDETYHGYGTARGLPSIYPAWLKLAGVQLGIALLCWLWLRGKRFGPVYTPRAWTVRRGDETLLAVAGWYERLGYRSEALSHQQLHLRQLLYERWGLSPSATAQQAAQAARVRWPEAQAERLARLLEAAPHNSAQNDAAGGEDVQSGAQRGQVSAKAFVEQTRELGEIIAYLEKE